MATRLLRSSASALVLSADLLAQSSATTFQGAMTSSGRNRPAINLAKEDLLLLSALLHRRASRRDIAQRLAVSDPELQRRLDLLTGEGLARADAGGRVLPTSVVVTLEDAPRYFQPDNGLVDRAARLIERRLAAVRLECQTFPSLANVPFDTMSFFVVSNVLLDNWQINNVERLFVRADRTLRTGGRYYFTILERRIEDPREPFGLYGNTASQWGTVQVGLYGNDRFSGHTLLSIPDEAFGRTFGFPEEMSPKDARARLAGHIVDALQGHADALTSTEREALAQLGLARGDSLNLLLLKQADYDGLGRIAALVTDELISILVGGRAGILATYRASPYADETSENEYLLCWYHFFFAAVTNRLGASGVIQIPPNGTTSYFVIP